MRRASPSPRKLRTEAAVPFLGVLIQQWTLSPPKGPLPPGCLSECQAFEQGTWPAVARLRVCRPSRVLGPSAQVRGTVSVAAASADD